MSFRRSLLALKSQFVPMGLVILVLKSSNACFTTGSSRTTYVPYPSAKMATTITCSFSLGVAHCSWCSCRPVLEYDRWQTRRGKRCLMSVSADGEHTWSKCASPLQPQVKAPLSTVIPHTCDAVAMMAAKKQRSWLLLVPENG